MKYLKEIFVEMPVNYLGLIIYTVVLLLFLKLLEVV